MKLVPRMTKGGRGLFRWKIVDLDNRDKKTKKPKAVAMQVGSMSTEASADNAMQLFLLNVPTPQLLSLEKAGKENRRLTETCKKLKEEKAEITSRYDKKFGRKHSALLACETRVKSLQNSVESFERELSRQSRFHKEHIDKLVLIWRSRVSLACIFAFLSSTLAIVLYFQ